ncbi:ABC transporter ATP-binding protein [endosymbiont of Ridgeia piscesae]|jgi:iron complex transport system ATP-binding protein|uniref:ABC-type cobalamin/Fe3+-siderophores transport system, ATPase component n=1 Tax=endosymbiont of Ridgeia piscesae TaxID=54398 RepID=A0A0T5YYV8_9GAMM|nr:ABC transporter ATP-binding protein [endosymbiont of Ridgeia piscesae]KRT55693.1 ABC-type cobalamin/Fe3+-siderophores transport system, ATPase component [endosymbiont of Ridgeia piscesae]KRT57966.1 iron complex transport system ATP-binding protein [endosymbiont of Ridgeia piscesae]
MRRLEATGLVFKRASREILQGINCHLDTGELVGIIGPNGAGKSTLLRLLAGLLQADAGQVWIDHEVLSQIAPRQRARTIGYLPQESPAHWPISVERLVTLGRLPHLAPWQPPAEADRQAVERALRQTELQALRHRPVDQLSGGERARVMIARMLAGEPPILLADEPVASLDPAHQLDIMQLFADHCSNGGSAALVLHDLRLAAHYCQRLLLIDAGRLVADGAPEQVLSAANLLRVFQLRPLTGETAFSIGWTKADALGPDR